LSRQELDELKSLYGDEAASYSTVKNWFNEFNRGRSWLEDEGGGKKQPLCRRTLMPCVS